MYTHFIQESSMDFSPTSHSLAMTPPSWKRESPSIPPSAFMKSQEKMTAFLDTAFTLTPFSPRSDPSHDFTIDLRTFLHPIKRMISSIQMKGSFVLSLLEEELSQLFLQNHAHLIRSPHAIEPHDIDLEIIIGKENYDIIHLNQLFLTHFQTLHSSTDLFFKIDVMQISNSNFILLCLRCDLQSRWMGEEPRYRTLDITILPEGGAYGEGALYTTDIKIDLTTPFLSPPSPAAIAFPQEENIWQTIVDFHTRERRFLRYNLNETACERMLYDYARGWRCRDERELQRIEQVASVFSSTNERVNFIVHLLAKRRFRRYQELFLFVQARKIFPTFLADEEWVTLSKRLWKEDSSLHPLHHLFQLLVRDGTMISIERAYAAVRWSDRIVAAYDLAPSLQGKSMELEEERPFIDQLSMREELLIHDHVSRITSSLQLAETRELHIVPNLQELLRKKNPLALLLAPLEKSEQRGRRLLEILPHLLLRLPKEERMLALRRINEELASHGTPFIDKLNQEETLSFPLAVDWIETLFKSSHPLAAKAAYGSLQEMWRKSTQPIFQEAIISLFANQPLERQLHLLSQLFDEEPISQQSIPALLITLFDKITSDLIALKNRSEATRLAFILSRPLLFLLQHRMFDPMEKKELFSLFQRGDDRTFKQIKALLPKEVLIQLQFIEDKRKEPPTPITQIHLEKLLTLDGNRLSDDQRWKYLKEIERRELSQEMIAPLLLKMKDAKLKLALIESLITKQKPLALISLKVIFDYFSSEKKNVDLFLRIHPSHLEINAREWLEERLLKEILPASPSLLSLLEARGWLQESFLSQLLPLIIAQGDERSLSLLLRQPSGEQCEEILRNLLHRIPQRQRIALVQSRRCQTTFQEEMELFPPPFDGQLSLFFWNRLLDASVDRTILYHRRAETSNVDDGPRLDDRKGVNIHIAIFQSRELSPGSHSKFHPDGGICQLLERLLQTGFPKDQPVLTKISRSQEFLFSFYSSLSEEGKFSLLSLIMNHREIDLLPSMVHPWFKLLNQYSKIDPEKSFSLLQMFFTKKIVQQKKSIDLFDLFLQLDEAPRLFSLLYSMIDPRRRGGNESIQEKILAFSHLLTHLSTEERFKIREIIPTIHKLYDFFKEEPTAHTLLLTSLLQDPIHPFFPPESYENYLDDLFHDEYERLIPDPYHQSIFFNEHDFVSIFSIWMERSTTIVTKRGHFPKTVGCAADLLAKADHLARLNPSEEFRLTIDEAKKRFIRALPPIIATCWEEFDGSQQLNFLYYSAIRLSSHLPPDDDRLEKLFHHIITAMERIDATRIGKEAGSLLLSLHQLGKCYIFSRDDEGGKKLLARYRAIEQRDDYGKTLSFSDTAISLLLDNDGDERKLKSTHIKSLPRHELQEIIEHIVQLLMRFPTIPMVNHLSYFFSRLHSLSAYLPKDYGQFFSSNQLFRVSLPFIFSHRESISTMLYSYYYFIEYDEAKNLLKQEGELRELFLHRLHETLITALVHNISDITRELYAVEEVVMRSIELHFIHLKKKKKEEEKKTVSDLIKTLILIVFKLSFFHHIAKAKGTGSPLIEEALSLPLNEEEREMGDYQLFCLFISHLDDRDSLLQMIKESPKTLTSLLNLTHQRPKKGLPLLFLLKEEKGSSWFKEKTKRVKKKLQTIRLELNDQELSWMDQLYGCEDTP